MTVEPLTKEEKERLLRALEVDREFRYAVMGLLGFKEILDRITRLEERQQKLEERQQRLEERFARLEERYQKLEERFAKLEERFAKLEERFAELEERVIRLEERVTGLEREIRKLWEAHLKLEERVEELARGQRELTAKIMALGYRYGVATEEAFRSAVRYLVEDLLREYEVKRWTYYDSEGLVYGHPAVVEVDVLVKDKVHVLVEYKSMADRSDVAELYRVGRLYEKVTGIQPRLLLVAPGYTRRAKELAARLGVELRGEQVD